MREAARFEDIKAEEQQLREHRESTLENLPGFLRLSPDQKRYLTASLYIQQRAERGTDLASASRIQETPEKFKGFLATPDSPYITHSDFLMPGESEMPDIQKDSKRYLKSQVNIMNNFCHRVIEKLEEYRQGELDTGSWVDAGPITSFEELEELIALATKQYEFPLVIQILDKVFGGVSHSALLLGKNDKGEFLVWKKAGWSMPFQLTSLKQVYEAYGHPTEWRMRPLSV